MSFYTTTHKSEDRKFLTGERFDAMTEHMVKHRGYDLEMLRKAVEGGPQVIWRMAPKDGHYYFAEVIG